MLKRLPEPTGFPEGLQDSEQTSTVRDAPGLDENDREETSRDPELQTISVEHNAPKSQLNDEQR